MKFKLMALLLCLLMGVLAACSGTEAEADTEPTSAPTQAGETLAAEPEETTAQDALQKPQKTDGTVQPAETPSEGKKQVDMSSDLKSKKFRTPTSKLNKSGSDDSTTKRQR